MIKKYFNLSHNIFARSFDEYTTRGINAVSYGIHDFKYIKGSKTPRTQSNFTFHYVFKGEGTLCIGGKNYTVSKGHYFILPPDILFAYYPNENNPWQYAWLGFSGDTYFISNLLENSKIKTCTPQLVQKGSKDIITALSLLDFSENNDKQSAGYCVISSLFKIMSIIHTENNNQDKKNLPRIVRQITEYVQSNYSNPDFSIANVAKIHSISHPYMCRLFLKHMGMSVKDYLISLRLNRACELLKLTDITVKEAAFACGFVDECYFSKLFKKKIGITAGSYRQSAHI